MPYPVLDSEHLVPVDTTDVDKDNSTSHCYCLKLVWKEAFMHLMGTHADFSSESIWKKKSSFESNLKGTPKTGCGM